MEAQKQPQNSSALGRADRMVMLPRELSQPWPGGSSLRNVGVWGSARPADVGNWHLGQLPSPAPAPCPGAYTSSGDCLSSKPTLSLWPAQAPGPRLERTRDFEKETLSDLNLSRFYILKLSECQHMAYQPGLVTLSSQTQSFHITYWKIYSKNY